MKQYNNDFIRLMLGGLLCLFVSACVSDPLADEQYTKKLTLVGVTGTNGKTTIAR